MKVSQFEMLPDCYFVDPKTNKRASVGKGEGWSLDGQFLRHGSRLVPIANVAYFDVQEETQPQRPSERPPEAGVARPAVEAKAPEPEKRRPGRPPNRTPGKVR